MGTKDVSLLKASYIGLEPLIRVVSVGKVALLAALIFLFQMYFWLYETGFLSKFGITNNLLSRSILEAEGIWIYFGIDLYLLFSEKIMLLVYVCILAIIASIFRTALIFKSRLDLASGMRRSSFFDNFRPNRQTARKIIIFFDLLALKNRKWLALALANYVFVLLSLIVLFLILFGKTFFELGEARSHKILDKFQSQNLCEDAYGYTGCYRITEGAKTYEGLLVARNDKQYFFYSNEKLLVINNNKTTLLSRTLKIKAGNAEDKDRKAKVTEKS